MQIRAIEIKGYDREKNQMEVCFGRGAPVLRYDWARDRKYYEVLDVTPEAVDVTRLSKGLPFMDSHAKHGVSYNETGLDRVLGKVVSTTLANGEIGGSVMLSNRDDKRLDNIKTDLADGILMNVSVGYEIQGVRMEAPETEGAPWTYRVTKWMPTELSLVAVGADPHGHARNLDHTPEENRLDVFSSCTIEVIEKQRSMSATDGVNMLGETDQQQAPVDQKTVAANERKRISEINAIAAQCRSFGEISAELIQKAIDNEHTPDAFRAAALADLSAKRDLTPPVKNVGLTTEVDESDVRRQAIGNAVAFRATPGAVKLDDSARKYAGLSLLELARESLREQGVNTSGLDKSTVAQMALTGRDLSGSVRGGMLTTSDFSVALANTVSRSLRQAYASAPQTFKEWARAGSLPDFRPSQRVQVFESVGLEKVNEKGEFKRGFMTDSGEVIQLATYGKIIAVSRQVIINDDLDVFSRIPQAMARAAANLESDTVYGLLLANPLMADGKAVFHADRGNLATGAGKASSVDTAGLDAARQYFRLLKDPGTGKPMSLTPEFIIVGANRETAATQQLMIPIVANQTSATNPFIGKMKVVVEPRITPNTGPEPWFAVAGPGQIDGLEYAYLDGQQGLYTEQQTGFDVDGLQIKARLDFGAKIIDSKGFYKNVGVA